MPDTEVANDLIERMIQNLLDEFEQTGILSSPSSERKSEIVDEIAKLRASMNPTIINNIYGPQS